MTGGVTVGEGASVIADAGADIGLGSPVQVTVLGSIVAHGGSITLSADDSAGYGFAQPGQLTVTTYTSPTKSVGGVARIRCRAGCFRDRADRSLRAAGAVGGVLAQPVTGKVLDGGSVVLSDDSGYVVGQAGSVIDVSGTAATFDELQATTNYAAQPVWSNAGSITLAASGGLYFDGTLKADAGAPQGQGGTLILQPEDPGRSFTGKNSDGTPFAMPGATAVILQQSGDFVPREPGAQYPDRHAGFRGRPPHRFRHRQADHRRRDQRGRQ